jgi:SAM-dependent methyltransferase
VHTDWKASLQQAEAGFALDVGAGSGRDANWLAEKGWKVIAVEPANELRKLAQANSHNSVTWCSASLPALTALPQAPKTYDLILLSAVWMHLPESERPLALNRLADLLSENGIMYISLRFGPNDDARPMHPVSYEELATLAQSNGLTARNLNPVPSQDGLQRDDVKWVTVEVVRG